MLLVLAAFTTVRNKGDVHEFWNTARSFKTVLLRTEFLIYFLPKIKARSVYHVNIKQVITFRALQTTASRIIKQKFQCLNHRCPACFSKNTFKKSSTATNYWQF